jgi:hypothetical protein
MQCQHLGSRSPIERRLHLFVCRECRGAKTADEIMTRGLKRLNAAPAPPEGLARTLATVGIPARAAKPRRARKFRSALKLRYLPAGTFTAAVALGAAAWMTYIDIDPKIAIPPGSMPSPNAHNLLLKAGAAIPLEDKTVMVGTYPQPPKRNRVALALDNRPGAKAAAGMAEVSGKPVLGDQRGASTERLSLTDRETIVREYDQAFKLVRQSFTYPCQAPPVRSESTSVDYLGDRQQLARALVLEAQVKAERHDFSGAASSSLDAMELGAQTARGSVMSGRVTGQACETMGRSLLWKVIDRLDGSTARSAARRMERIIGMRTPFVDALQEEKWAMIASLKAMMARPDWRARFRTSYSTADAGMGLSSYAALLPFTKTRILNDYSRLMDRTISEASGPYWKIAATPLESNGKTAADNLFEKEMSRDPVVALFFPVFGSARFNEVAGCETQDALLACAMALQAYRQEHHALPRQLQELVPEYLSAVPMDPFAKDRPISYAPSEQERISIDGGQHWYARIYSVGPDRTDDGGAPINHKTDRDSFGNRITTNRKAPDNKAWLISRVSQGDIVAGINTSVSQ